MVLPCDGVTGGEQLHRVKANCRPFSRALDTASMFEVVANALHPTTLQTSLHVQVYGGLPIKARTASSAWL